MDMPLFTSAGEVVTTVTVKHLPNARPPGIIRWQGRFFANQNGRFVECEVLDA